MDGNDKIYPCFDMKTGDYILFGEYNTILQKSGNNDSNPGTPYFKGFRGLFFEIDTQIDTESHSSLFPLPQKCPKYKGFELQTSIIYLY